MSKNTLFNYFNRSPATKPKLTHSESPSTSSKSSSSNTPKTTPKASNKRPPESARKDTPKQSKKENDDDDDDEEIIKQKTKRRRILSGDSDSDRENSQDSQNKTTLVEEVQTPKRRFLDAKFEYKAKTPSLNDTSELNATPTAKKVKKEPEHNVTLKDEIEGVALLDEPTIWRHDKVEFLGPKKIKDKHGRRPSHDEYDPTTLYVPEDYLNTLTPAMRQWWVLKSDYFDTVLFFKVGKFYELYHMDATVGVNELGFSYMKGDFAHSGFPESAYERMATSLVERGYKVARVEQTETPDMMEQRIKATTRKVTKFDKVVKREICQVSMKGTEVFTQQIHMTFNHQPRYMLAISEKGGRYGVCFIDTSIGQFYVGEFSDDKQNSRLLTLCSHYPPTLILHERNGISASTMQIFKTILCNVKKEPLTHDTQFWSGEKTLKFLAENYYCKDDEQNWPEIFKEMQDTDDHLGLTPSNDYSLAFRALGACIFFMQKFFIDQQVLGMAQYKMYIPPDSELKPSKIEAANTNRLMVLDNITLSNLRITGEDYSLQQTIDFCCTKFGKRLLSTWICSPSCEVDVIIERQNAITELLDDPEKLQEVRMLLGQLPDLERQLAQIHGFGNYEKSKNHPDARAILYEEKTYGKKKIQDFISTLNGFESLMQIPKMFKNCESKFLKFLTQIKGGSFPNMKETLEFFKSSFDQDEALKEGVIAPGKGVDAEYDAVEEAIEEIHQESEAYLKQQEKHFGAKLAYFGTEKKRFQLEVPEGAAKKAGNGYSLESQRKGKAKRFHTDETKDFLKRLLKAEDDRKTVLKDLSRRIFEKFSKEYTMWKSCVDLVGILDVLVSLAEYARNSDNSCIPEFVSGEKPIFELEDGVHPCMATKEDFIPNGISLGEDTAPLALLTGPNMGGKSTLMRQMGLLVVLAQIGSRIPASKCRMSLIDRIFTRLGAQDDIMAGHSTFLVELSETSAILKHATVKSLVLLDELGRGTSTYDGTSIAGAVVNYLADLKCLTMFSTHYHNLVDNFQEDLRITLGHMACMVENESEDDPTEETVTFLYKYSDGPCPKSYGFNAAKLAGMPRSIIKRAHELSKKVEATALKRKLFTKLLCRADREELKDLLVKLKACSL